MFRFQSQKFQASNVGYLELCDTNKLDENNNKQVKSSLLNSEKKNNFFSLLQFQASSVSRVL